MTDKTALVVGATGVIGRYLVEHLEALGDWQVIGLARRVPDEAGPRTRYLSVDLLDAAATEAALAPLAEVTHVFYAAYLDRPSMAELVAPNLALLVNVIEALDPRRTGQRQDAVSLDFVSQRCCRASVPLSWVRPHPARRARFQNGSDVCQSLRSNSLE